MNHRCSHLIKFTKEAGNNKFSFANGESSHVKEKLVIHLKNPQHPTGWTTTTADILDKGRVPILFSVEQMRNLRINIEHTPAGEILTCPVFGLKRNALSVGTSNHPTLDARFLAKCGHKPDHSFAATTNITCPACNGKHRSHTYDEHCNLERPKEKDTIEGKGRAKKGEAHKSADQNLPVNKPDTQSQHPKQRLGVKTQPTQRPTEEESIPIDPDKAIVEELPRTSSSSGPKKPVVVEDEPVVPTRQKKIQK